MMNRGMECAGVLSLLQVTTKHVQGLQQSHISHKAAWAIVLEWIRTIACDRMQSAANVN